MVTGWIQIVVMVAVLTLLTPPLGGYNRPIGASAPTQAQPPDLRTRRHHRPFHRHQADRPAHPQPARSMRTAELPIPHRVPRSTRRHKPLWENRIVARALAPRIDRELARGTPSWSTVVYATRAVHLTGTRSRCSLARSLELLVEHAERPTRPGRSAGDPRLPRAGTRRASRDHGDRRVAADRRAGRCAGRRDVARGPRRRRRAMLRPQSPGCAHRAAARVVAMPPRGVLASKPRA